MLKITLVRSVIGRPDTQRKTVRSLGLRKLNSFSILPDSPSIRGQIQKVAHLLKVEDYKEAQADEIART
ncbi:MAG: 50S ribosomal protein L30 [Selenomonadaceae bacterium]|nr:50S ribosomal protein L30 [Selenomonadaceae bacterium]MBQ6131223.1 50S ribosomal protein L30 [Selenomonadaceae bacterium]MBQ7493397.1 50S ribosomal protein L30 [Selenomonadaceae bacterium]